MTGDPQHDRRDIFCDPLSKSHRVPDEPWFPAVRAVQSSCSVTSLTFSRLSRWVQCASHRGGETTRAREGLGTVSARRRLGVETVTAQFCAAYIPREPSEDRGRNDAWLVFVEGGIRR